MQVDFIDKLILAQAGSFFNFMLNQIFLQQFGGGCEPKYFAARLLRQIKLRIGILAALVLVQSEKFFRKIVPPVVSMIIVPFCSLLLTVVAAHFVLGPVG